MKRTAGRITAIGGLAVGGSLALLMAGADAHHPEVSAITACADGFAQVQINASSWLTDIPDHRHNPDVAVSYDGTVIGRGAFLPSNNYQFTLSYRTAANGSTHTVRVTAIAPFGVVGEYGHAGEFRETSVTLPTTCPAPPTTTAAPTTTANGSSTSTGSGSGDASSTNAGNGNVPVVVGGQVENRPDIASPIAVQPRFAG